MTRKSIITIVTAIVLASCAPTPFINIEQKDNIPELGPGESYIDVKFTTLNEWSATSNQKWVTVTPSSGAGGSSTIRVSASANPEYSVRSALVFITSGSLSESFTVKQKEREGVIVPQTSYAAKAEGGEISIPISTNTDFSWIMDADARDWLSGMKTKSEFKDHELLVKVAANNETYMRRGGITVTAGSASESIHILQDTKYDVVKMAVVHNGAEMAINCEGGDFSCVIDWGDGEKTEAIGENSHQYKGEPTTRNVTIDAKGLNSVTVPSLSNVELIDIWCVRK